MKPWALPHRQMLRATVVGLEAREALLSTEEVVGHVHSTFRKVVNIVTPHGRLLSIACHGVPMLTSNVATSQTQGFLACDTGTKAHISENTLHFGAMAVSDLALARMYTPRKWEEVRVASKPRVESTLARTADQAVNIVGTRGLAALIPALRYGPFLPLAHVPFDISYDHNIGRHLLRLVAEICNDEEPLSAKKLIGLGPGLTPSGDDVLAGLVASLHAITRAHGRLHSRALQALTHITMEAKGSTTLISCEMLRHAARGHMTDAAENVITSILRGDDCRPDLVILAQYGATSGIDQLIGILLGIHLFYCHDKVELAPNVD